MSATIPEVGTGLLEDASSGIIDNYPDVDQRSCRLLGPTALIVQALLGVLVILSLVFKRHRETPKRPWRIWLFDVSKQVVGQMFVHGANLFVSDLGSHHTSGNACVFYFLNILIDTTLGVGFIYISLRLLTHLFSKKLQYKGFESGIYGTPPSVNYWARQAAIYVLSLTAMKLIVLGFLALFPFIFKAGEWLLSWTWTGKGDWLQVIFTMGIFPIIMNIVQFWLIDSIVKASAPSSVALDADGFDSLHSVDREPLFGASSDDEDDSMDAPRHDVENPPPIIRSSMSTQDESDKTSGLPQTPPDLKTSGRSTPSENLDHSYPPSLSNTPSSSPRMHNGSPRVATNLMKKAKRRGPPTPLNIHDVHQPAINSPQTANIRQPTPRIKNPNANLKPVPDPSNKDWAESWDDSEDWADRVGEDEWTGRRIEEKKDILKDVWDSSPAVRPEQ